MEDVTLLVGGQNFKVNKDVLSEHSDYFRAMFSGNFMENEQQEIAIDVVDAHSMGIIIQYMQIGIIDLFEYSLSTIGDLAMAANFLQITELIKQIEYTLELQMSISNWMEIMAIADNASYSKLQQLCAAFGLLSFRNMKSEYVPSIHKLFWYLAHPYLDAGNELDVFRFGFQWITHKETGADALLIILGCLDMKRLTISELVEIKKLIKDYEVSLAAKVIDCILELFIGNVALTIPDISEQKSVLSEKFTERVYNEVINLVRESRIRTLCYEPAVPIWKVKDEKPELTHHFLYTFTVKSGFVQWLEVAEKSLWGWSVIAWGPMKLVAVCGEYGRGTGIFMKDVKVYDTLKKEWIHHGADLPPRRHGGLAIVDDSLYIIGGVGGFRVVLHTAIIYDLKQRTFRKIANLPDAIQNPAVCAHEGKVYAAGHNNIYQYEDLGDRDRWIRIIGTDIRMSCMVSYNGYIYCTQNYFSYLYRFKPGVDKKLNLIASFGNPPAAICNLGDRLLFFTRTMCGHSDALAVEEFTGTVADEKPKVIWAESDTESKINDVAGSCSLVMTMPPVTQSISQYHRRYLMKYSDQ
ncbi:kelch-like protein 30 [Pectinophora gossypiella]|uniref:kelch-like protein 30 n=1 Tax=Pectinophora gossypiella TaxID=13191 RepID=UPI00214DFADC|nr:kelch-like protein 30 [Pectinophora gossypiella]